MFNQEGLHDELHCHLALGAGGWVAATLEGGGGEDGKVGLEGSPCAVSDRHMHARPPNLLYFGLN